MAIANPPAYAFGAAPRVNLMPRAETDRREKSRLMRRWVGALVLAVLVVVGVAAAGLWVNIGAMQRLGLETTRTNTLLAQLDGLSDVRAMVDLQSELTDFRRDAMATDLRWSGLIATVAGGLPEGVVITGYSLAPAGMPQGDVPEEEIGAAGTVELVSQAPRDIVDLVRAVRPLPGVIDADGWEVTAEDAGYVYQIRIAFDQTVYTGAYKEDSE
ncbi:hypothetical protein ASD93_04460 [Microbacterium sp. Root180]|nr:hypothetical protein ASD93_04460 [Microbacterium sp. Root180]